MSISSESLDIFSDSENEDEILQNSQPILTMQNTKIMDVFAINFHEELKKMAKLAETFNCISMDTQFPGQIISPHQRWHGQDEKEYQYELIRDNVNKSKIIQIGFTLADQHGRVPLGVCTWQFNFKFYLQFDVINSDSKDLLINAGIDFNKLQFQGIDVKDFAEHWVSCGIPLNKKIKWVVFHGSYDFAYLLKIVHGDGLPSVCSDFYRLTKSYYPNIIDIKYFIKDIPSLKYVNLKKLGAEFGCSWIGPQHQAGSDSLLALRCYFKLKEREHIFKSLDYLNVIYGIGDGCLKGNNQNNSNVQSYPNYGGATIQEQHNYIHNNMYYYHPNHQNELYYYYEQHYRYS